MEAYLRNSGIRFKTDQDVKEILPVLEKARDALVHNVVSVTAITTLVNGSTKIEPKHVDATLQYIQRKCGTKLTSKAGKMAGGTVMTAKFFDPTADTMYSAANAGPSSSDTVNFEMGVARDAVSIHGPGTQSFLSMDGGAMHKTSWKWLVGPTSDVLQHYRVKISKGAREEVHQIIKHLFKCLVEDLKKKEPVSVSKVREVLKRKHNAIFH